MSASGGGASAPVQSMTASTATLAYGIIEVATTPSNANIVIDGQEVGLSPVRKENIVTGQHRIVIVLPGYETITKIDALAIAAREQIELQRRLEKIRCCR